VWFGIAWALAYLTVCVLTPLRCVWRISALLATQSLVITLFEETNFVFVAKAEALSQRLSDLNKVQPWLALFELGTGSFLGGAGLVRSRAGDIRGRGGWFRHVAG